MPVANEGNRFVWHELMTTDPGAAVAFYTDVVGWGTEEWASGESPYTIWKAGDRSVGGVMATPPGVEAPPAWLGYVGVEDAARCARRAEELGGRVVKEPTAIPDVGRFAVLQDPQGAMIAVLESAQPRPPRGAPGVSEFSWNELATTDHKGAWDFYSRLFGWEKTEAMDMGELGVYQMFGTGSLPLGAMYDKNADQPGPPAWLFYARVADLDDALERVRAGGGRVLSGPMEVPGGAHVAVCADPQGAAFALHRAAS